jgi:hypothetical protein
LLTFLLATQEKVSRPPGRVPASNPQQKAHSPEQNSLDKPSPN